MQVRRVGWPAILAVALAGAPACGDGDDRGISQRAVDNFQGMYQLATATENLSACNVEGPSALDTITEKQFVVVGTGSSNFTIWVVSCFDDAACAGTVTAILRGGTLGEWWALLTEQSAPERLDGWAGTSLVSEDGVCIDRTFTDLSLIREGTAVRLETRLTFLPDRLGPCPSGDALRSEAAEHPCSSFKVFAGPKRGPLP
jgi:hypothetical protein